MTPDWGLLAFILAVIALAISIAGWVIDRKRD
jgi:hypothetical protein